jgi:phospho-N-acetylmuramoyl-pentapeptide-transferase
LIGFLDDYIKVFKKNKKGLAGKFKVIGQIGVGIIVGASMYWSDSVTIKSKTYYNTEILADQQEISKESKSYFWEETKSLKTTIPFVKNNEFDYSWLISWISPELSKYSWLVFIPIIVIIVISVSNGANLTDGLDGLATGTSAIIGITLAIFAYLSGNLVFSDYLNILYIPNSSELVIFISSFVGACIGFLWYNSFPAKVFMGDTGSLALGGIIAVFAIAIRKELLIPVFCGVFLIENLSVVLQVSYFKYTKRKFGEGRRIFLMSPIHHHYQKKGIHEAKIVSRFWILGILLAVLSIVTLKLR